MVFIHHILPQSAMIIHWLCYCTAVSMLSFLPVIVCGLLELKRICVGSLLIVWDGNESVQEFYYLLGVDANLCRIFNDCLEWKWICVGFLLLAWSGCESVQDFYWLLGVKMNICRIFIACFQWKRICAGFLLLAWSVNESVQVIYCLFMSISALGIQLFCLIPAYYVLVTSYALVFQRRMLWSSMIWFEVRGCWYLW